MPPTYFPLRWESTGDQWWYASPIDCAAANGHYDLVRELLRLDGNHFIKLTSLRRTRRLEAVWDDDAQFHDVAKCRSEVAKKLYLESVTHKKGNKNSLIQSGYGGWLLYTAASAGDLGFVTELLEKDPLLVFGEGEYGVTDIFYAAARSKKCQVFRLLFDFAVSRRFISGKNGGEFGEIPVVYKREMMNRAVHAAARGGNLEILKELVCKCDDVLGYRDTQGSTVLHAAAGRGQVPVVKYLIQSIDIINLKDHQGNTALHIAAYRGQLVVVEALVHASPSSISLKNNAGETFLHMAVSGFRTPLFRRLDKQIELMKQLVCNKVFNLQDIINVKNNEGRTALHMAIVGNIHSDLVQLLMIVSSIDVNVRDSNLMTPLDILKQRPRSESSEMLTTHLISAGGILGTQDYTGRRSSLVSHLKMFGNGTSPGTSFRIRDSEIFLYTGIEKKTDVTASRTSIRGRSLDFAELNQFKSSNNIHPSHDIPLDHKRKGVVNNAAQRLKRLLHWHNVKDKNKAPEKLKQTVEDVSVESSSVKLSDSMKETAIPLRQRFSKPSSLPNNNKRTLSVRSNVPSPLAKKKMASGLKHGVMQAMPELNTPRRSHSYSISKSSFSSDIYVENDTAGSSSCSNQMLDDGIPIFVEKQASLNRRLVNQYLCFGQPPKDSVSRLQQNQSYKNYVISVA